MNEKVLNNVRELRKRADVTQEELAVMVGVSRQTIISIERGRYVPSLALALKIARYFECSMDDMFELKED
jgi:putative transcriptional regulator